MFSRSYPIWIDLILVGDILVCSKHRFLNSYETLEDELIFQTWVVYPIFLFIYILRLFGSSSVGMNFVSSTLRDEYISIWLLLILFSS